jgi:L-2-hydroxyglutarate oxidase
LGLFESAYTSGGDENLYDFLIVGAGIVGLSVGMHLLKEVPHAKLAIVEKEPEICRHQTGHNSGVIHSGIYYTPGSFKARFARMGSERLIAFCKEKDIPYEQCGKLIVAVDEKELPWLENLYQRGLTNGLKIRMVDADEIHEIEPFVQGISGIYVPETGIVDFKRVAAVYAEEITAKNGEILTATQVQNVHTTKDFIELETNRGMYRAKYMINCAGLFSDKIAKLTGLKTDVIIVPFRGEYYELKEEKRYLVKNLVYPVPNPELPFLGVHFTRMIDGHVHIGPNAVLGFRREAYKKTDINIKELAETLSFKGFWKMAQTYMGKGVKEMVRSFSRKAFLKNVQKYFPQIEASDLTPSSAGVRAQALTKEGQLFDDFYILEAERSFHIGNAPSPAATASLEIGSYIAHLVKNKIHTIGKEDVHV